MNREKEQINIMYRNLCNELNKLIAESNELYAQIEQLQTKNTEIDSERQKVAKFKTELENFYKIGPRFKSSETKSCLDEEDINIIEKG